MNGNGRSGTLFDVAIGRSIIVLLLPFLLVFAILLLDKGLSLFGILDPASTLQMAKLAAKRASGSR